LPAVLSAVGTVLFGYLSIGYSEFYGRLGTSPDDVGLTYVSTLTHSAGLVVLVAVVAALSARVYVRRRLMRQLKQMNDGLGRQRILEAHGQTVETHDAMEQKAAILADRLEEMRALAQQRLESDDPEHRAEGEKMLNTHDALADAGATALAASASVLGSGKEIASHTMAVRDAVRLTERERRIGIGLLVGALVGGALLITIPLVVGPRAERVTDGEPVGPIRIPGITLLDVSARRASIEPTGDGAKAQAVSGLSRRELLYLGRSAGTIVLFDPAVDRAVYVPSSTAIVRVEP
jgi:hypothetical protein